MPVNGSDSGASTGSVTGVIRDVPVPRRARARHGFSADHPVMVGWFYVVHSVISLLPLCLFDFLLVSVCRSSF